MRLLQSIVGNANSNKNLPLSREGGRFRPSFCFGLDRSERNLRPTSQNKISAPPPPPPRVCDGSEKKYRVLLSSALHPTKATQNVGSTKSSCCLLTKKYSSSRSREQNRRKNYIGGFYLRPLKKKINNFTCCPSRTSPFATFLTRQDTFFANEKYPYIIELRVLDNIILYYIIRSTILQSKLVRVEFYEKY